MNSLLLFLFLGASVALAELPFEHPDFVEFLNEEVHEELLGELADEENDPRRPHPSGRPSGRPSGHPSGRPSGRPGGRPSGRPRPSRFPRPSGTPPAFVKECKEKLGACINNADDEPCARLKCLEQFGECLKENLPSPRPTLPFTLPPKKKMCLVLGKKCYENADDCKAKIRCIICTRFCLKRGRVPRFCRPRPSGKPSRPFTRPSRPNRPSGRPTRPPRD